MIKIPPKSLRQRILHTKSIIHEIMDITPNPLVSFSGGKDSGVMVELALQCAAERKQEVTVDFFDQEIIPFQTAEYVQRQMGRPYLNLRYWCLPLRENNAGSKDPWWWPWEPAKEKFWVRPIPEFAITKHPCLQLNDKGVCEDDLISFYQKLQRWSGGSIVMLGQRAEESPARRAFTYNIKTVQQEDLDMYRRLYIISSAKFKGCRRSYPMSEWLLEDIWGAVDCYKWDWNKAYVVMHNSGVSPKNARIGPLFGEEPMNSLWSVMRCFPEVWTKLEHRVSGPQAVSRYSHTELYGRGKKIQVRSISHAIELVRKNLLELPIEKRASAAKSIKDTLDFAIRTGQISDMQIKALLRAALLGDTKAGRARASGQLQATVNLSDKGRFIPGTRDHIRAKTIRRMQRVEREREEKARKKREKEKYNLV